MAENTHNSELHFGLANHGAQETKAFAELGQEYVSVGCLFSSPVLRVFLLCIAEVFAHEHSQVTALMCVECDGTGCWCAVPPHTSS